MRPDGWVVGGSPYPGESVIALTLEEVHRAVSAGVEHVPFHELAVREVDPADRVRVVVPRWRGDSFLVHLEWLVRTRLASGSAEVSWVFDRRLGRPGTTRILAGLGWELDHEIQERHRILTGRPPDDGSPAEPLPREFRHDDRSFSSDWGAFSGDHVDDGTLLLLDAVRSFGSGSLADVGTGYGALAVLLASAVLAPSSSAARWTPCRWTWPGATWPGPASAASSCSKTTRLRFPRPSSPSATSRHTRPQRTGTGSSEACPPGPGREG